MPGAGGPIMPNSTGLLILCFFPGRRKARPDPIFLRPDPIFLKYILQDLLRIAEKRSKNYTHSSQLGERPGIEYACRLSARPNASSQLNLLDHDPFRPCTSLGHRVYLRGVSKMATKRSAPTSKPAAASKPAAKTTPAKPAVGKPAPNPASKGPARPSSRGR